MGMQYPEKTLLMDDIGKPKTSKIVCRSCGHITLLDKALISLETGKFICDACGNAATTDLIVKFWIKKE